MTALHDRKKRTKADGRASLNILLVMAADLDRLTVGQLVRTHGLSQVEVAKAFDAERQRRNSQ